MVLGRWRSFKVLTRAPSRNPKVDSVSRFLLGRVFGTAFVRLPRSPETKASRASEVADNSQDLLDK
jgi:hypothetical protein